MLSFKEFLLQESKIKYVEETIYGETVKGHWKTFTIMGQHGKWFIDTNNVIRNGSMTGFDLKIFHMDKDTIKAVEKLCNISSDDASNDEINNLVNKYADLDSKCTEFNKKKIQYSLSLKPKSVVIEKIDPKDSKTVNDLVKATQCTAEETAKGIKIANEKVEQAKKICDEIITPEIVDIIGGLKGSMYGLEHRIKQPKSYARKLLQDAKEIYLDSRKDEENIDFDSALSQASNNVKDSIRFTAIFDKNNYSKSFNETLNKLESKGYKHLVTKNYFKKFRDEDYRQKAVQCSFEKEGIKFELQFHTVDSHAVKDTTHPWYEISRRSDVATTAQHNFYEKRTRKAGENIPDPKGVFDIPDYPPKIKINEGIKMKTFKEFILESNIDNSIKSYYNKRKEVSEVEQMNESLVTDYYVKFGKFIYKHVHPVKDYLKGKKYRWIKPKKCWVEDVFDRYSENIDDISEKEALEIAGVRHW